MARLSGLRAVSSSMAVGKMRAEMRRAATALGRWAAREGATRASRVSIARGLADDSAMCGEDGNCEGGGSEGGGGSGGDKGGEGNGGSGGGGGYGGGDSGGGSGGGDRRLHLEAQARRQLGALAVIGEGSASH